MNELNITSSLPLQVLMEMGKENPDVLKTTQLNISINAQDFVDCMQSMQRMNEALLEQYFQRLLRDDQKLKYVTTQELKENYGISRNTANTLQHEGVFTQVTKIGRQNAYLRTEVQAYVSDVKAHQKVSPY